MQVYNGKSVFGGVAIGKISVYQKKEQKESVSFRDFMTKH